jgi:hypothetical protein
MADVPALNNPVVPAEVPAEVPEEVPEVAMAVALVNNNNTLCTTFGTLGTAAPK